MYFDFDELLGAVLYMQDFLEQVWLSAELGLVVDHLTINPHPHPYHLAAVETRLIGQCESSQSSFVSLTVNTSALILPYLTIPHI